MKASKAIMILLAPVVLLLNRCDTTGSVDDPTKNYYMKFIGKEGEQTGVDFEVDTDGTLILFGTTKASGQHSQLWIVRASAEGNVIWEKEYGNPLDDEARDVEILRDGRIAILGNSYRSGSTGNGSRDIFVATLTADGAIDDSVTLGYQHVITGANTDENATTITQTDDGFVIAGSSENLRRLSEPTVRRDGLIIRVYDDLTRYAPTWTYPPTFGQGDENITTKMIQLPSGDFYVFGYSRWSNYRTSSDFDWWYFGLGKGGGEPTQRTSLGAPLIDEKLTSVAAVPLQLGDGYFLAGLLKEQNGSSSLYTGRLRNPLAYDSSDIQFGPAIKGSSLGKPTNELVGVCVTQTSEFYVLANDASATNGNNNLRLSKLGSVGEEKWTTALYGGQGDDFIGNVRELSDGKVIVFGTISTGQNNEPKMVLIKVNKDGQFAK